MTLSWREMDRNFSSAMPRQRQKLGRLYSAVSGGAVSRRKSSLGLPRPTAVRMIRPHRGWLDPNSDEASKPRSISRGTGISNPSPSSAESRANFSLGERSQESPDQRRQGRIASRGPSTGRSELTSSTGARGVTTILFGNFGIGFAPYRWSRASPQSRCSSSRRPGGSWAVTG
jgi:hypothetical protein